MLRFTDHQWVKHFLQLCCFHRVPRNRSQITAIVRLSPSVRSMGENQQLEIRGQLVLLSCVIMCIYNVIGLLDVNAVSWAETLERRLDWLSSSHCIDGSFPQSWRNPIRSLWTFLHFVKGDGFAQTCVIVCVLFLESRWCQCWCRLHRPFFSTNPTLELIRGSVILVILVI